MFLRTPYRTAVIENCHKALELFCFKTVGGGKKHMHSGGVRLKMKTPEWVRGSDASPHVPERDSVELTQEPVK